MSMIHVNVDMKNKLKVEDWGWNYKGFFCGTLRNVGVGFIFVSVGCGSLACCAGEGAGAV